MKHLSLFLLLPLFILSQPLWASSSKSHSVSKAPKTSKVFDLSEAQHVYSFKTKDMVSAHINKPVLVVQEHCMACDALMKSYKAELEAKDIIVVAMFEPSKEWLTKIYPLENDIYNYGGVAEKLGITKKPRATPALLTLNKKVVYGTGKITKSLGIAEK